MLYLYDMPVLANFTYTGIPGVNRLEKNCFFFIEIASTDTFFGGNSDDFT